LTNLEFINEYRNMKSVGDFCKITGVQHSNLIQGRTTKENEQKIATLCKFEIIRLYQEVIKDNVIKTDSL
jgi:hypothetical protein